MSLHFLLLSLSLFFLLVLSVPPSRSIVPRTHAVADSAGPYKPAAWRFTESGNPYNRLGGLTAKFAVFTEARHAHTRRTSALLEAITEVYALLGRPSHALERSGLTVGNGRCVPLITPLPATFREYRRN